MTISVFANEPRDEGGPLPREANKRAGSLTGSRSQANSNSLARGAARQPLTENIRASPGNEFRRPVDLESNEPDIAFIQFSPIRAGVSATPASSRPPATLGRSDINSGCDDLLCFTIRNGNHLSLS